LEEVIDNKIVAAGSNEIEKLEWTAMKCLARKSYSSLYDALGINIDKVNSDAEKLTGKKKNKGKSSPKAKPVKAKGPASLDASGATDFFAGLANQSIAKPVEEEKTETEVPTTQMIKETISRNGNWDVGPEGIVKRSLLVGNTEAAAECLLKSGRPAEALLLAMTCKDD